MEMSEFWSEAEKKQFVRQLSTNQYKSKSTL